MTHGICARPKIAVGNTTLGSERWKSKAVALRYSVGYLKLFEVTFKVLENSMPFDPDCAVSTEFDPPGETSGCSRHSDRETPVPDVHDRRDSALSTLAAVFATAAPSLLHGPARRLGTGVSVHVGENAFDDHGRVRNYERFCDGQIPLA